MTPIAKRAIVKKRTKKFKRPQSDRILHVPVSCCPVGRRLVQRRPKLVLTHARCSRVVTAPFHFFRHEIFDAGYEQKFMRLGLEWLGVAVSPA